MKNIKRIFTTGMVIVILFVGLAAIPSSQANAAVGEAFLSITTSGACMNGNGTGTLLVHLVGLRAWLVAQFVPTPWYKVGGAQFPVSLGPSFPVPSNLWQATELADEVRYTIPQGSYKLLVSPLPGYTWNGADVGIVAIGACQ